MSSPLDRIHKGLTAAGRTPTEDLVRSIASCTKDGETQDDSDDIFVMEPEDAIETLHHYIDEARSITPPTDEELEAMDISTDQEYVVLVAISVGGCSAFEDAHHVVMDTLRPLIRDNGGPLESWWIAEDERYDGSDNDSAVFVPIGTQRAFSDMIAALRAAVR